MVDAVLRICLECSRGWVGAHAQARTPIVPFPFCLGSPGSPALLLPGPAAAGPCCLVRYGQTTREDEYYGRWVPAAAEVGQVQCLGLFAVPNDWLTGGQDPWRCIQEPYPPSRPLCPSTLPWPWSTTPTAALLHCCTASGVLALKSVADVRPDEELPFVLNLKRHRPGRSPGSMMTSAGQVGSACHGTLHSSRGQQEGRRPRVDIGRLAKYEVWRN